jgi:hypothetical protein
MYCGVDYNYLKESIAVVQARHIINPVNCAALITGFWPGESQI